MSSIESCLQWQSLKASAGEMLQVLLRLLVRWCHVPRLHGKSAQQALDTCWDSGIPGGRIISEAAYLKFAGLQQLRRPTRRVLRVGNRQPRTPIHHSRNRTPRGSGSASLLV